MYDGYDGGEHFIHDLFYGQKVLASTMHNEISMTQ